MNSNELNEEAESWKWKPPSPYEALISVKGRSPNYDVVSK